MACSGVDLVDLAWEDHPESSICKVQRQCREIRVKFAPEVEKAGAKDVYGPIRILAEGRRGEAGNASGPDQRDRTRFGIQGIKVISEISDIVVSVDKANPKSGVRPARRNRGGAGRLS